MYEVSCLLFLIKDIDKKLDVLIAQNGEPWLDKILSYSVLVSRE